MQGRHDVSIVKCKRFWRNNVCDDMSHWSSLLCSCPCAWACDDGDACLHTCVDWIGLYVTHWQSKAACTQWPIEECCSRVSVVVQMASVRHIIQTWVNNCILVYKKVLSAVLVKRADMNLILKFELLSPHTVLLGNWKWIKGLWLE